MIASKLIVGGVLLMTLYIAVHDHDASWLEASALCVLVGGGYLASMQSYRLELDDSELRLASVYGRTVISLSKVVRVRISHLASQAPFAITFDVQHGLPVTWRVHLFGENLKPILAALSARYDVVDQRGR
jgi:hypothetical protein